MFSGCGIFLLANTLSSGPGGQIAKTSLKLACDVAQHNIVYKVVNSIKPIISEITNPLSLPLAHLQTKFESLTSYVISSGKRSCKAINDVSGEGDWCQCCLALLWDTEMS